MTEFITPKRPEAQIPIFEQEPEQEAIASAPVSNLPEAAPQEATRLVEPEEQAVLDTAREVAASSGATEEPVDPEVQAALKEVAKGGDVYAMASQDPDKVLDGINAMLKDRE